jgi:hypothetical protein
MALRMLISIQLGLSAQTKEVLQLALVQADSGSAVLVSKANSTKLKIHLNQSFKIV